MKKVKRFLALLPALILWLMFSILLWGFVFTRITDTAAEKKLVLCVDAPVPGATDLAVALEAYADEGIRMVKVHPFTYAMMNGDALRSADLYIVKESDIPQYRDWFLPLPQAFDGRPVYSMEGEAYGVLVYDAKKQTGAAQAYIDYIQPSETPENCYLLFGKNSVHVSTNENAVDNAAVHLAEALLKEFN